ncbi:hypothetical protein D3C87_1808340 [compost metagenome]
MLNDSCKRAITVARSPLRSACGFSAICMRPALSVALLPSTPMNEDTACTSGSSSTRRAAACWRSAMAGNEMDCGPCVMAWIRPVSCCGKKPLGTIRYNTAVSANVPSATNRVSV